MAYISSLSSFSLSNFSAPLPISICSSSSAFLTSQIPCKPTKRSKPKGHHVSKVSCNSNQNTPTPNPEEEKPSSYNILGKHRRDVLLGIGGLYGASALSNTNPLAMAAAPILEPDLEHCCITDDVPPKGVIEAQVYCCPPRSSSPPIDFKLPKGTPLRVRPPAQFVTDEYLEKYKLALKRMRELPSDDPRSFKQQADIHCAYCDGGYKQLGFPVELDFKVHFSWIFFPFHRWYLYFYERILGSLIDDPTFALPYWNWDNPDGGMVLPSIFADEDSPLYDPRRNPDITPTTLVDLNYGSGKEPSVEQNLGVMYTSVVSGAKRASLFHGKPFLAGKQPELGGGTVELGPHTAVHRWTGDPRQPNKEDMGRFYSAGRDPAFYSHHANVDRMWNIWKTIPSGKRRDFKNRDWLETSFFFYDENKTLVRVKVKDSLDTNKMGYVYQDVAIPWLEKKPKPKRTRKAKKVAFAQQFGGIGAAMAAETGPSSKFPLTLLDSKVTLLVKRPKQLRSKRDKEEEEEVLVIDGIEFDGDDDVKFDVYITDEDVEDIGPESTEFAGSFSTLGHSHSNMNMDKKIKTSLTLGITDLLEDLDAENDDSVLVTLVPRSENVSITIQNIKIEFEKEE
ncbi:Polyphenol oxidase A1, chloroplastic [Glycine soja]|uniref:Polyphenol oxidase A1, chloroplastic n=1 Tax=Glycine soja TaxID=3848 RepID=A0A0B2SNE1_GLYSO|nr:Polyphenol oxidase A1, chloroplastic [Glycine soja]